MVTLRLSQMGPLVDGSYTVEISLEGLGAARRTAKAQIQPVTDDTDLARMRWYLETYPEKNAAPAPTVAANVERRMAEIGRKLFSEIFEANRDTNRLWNDVSDHLADARVEISTGIREAHSIPWELLRDPRTDAPLALNAAEFVHVQSQTGRDPHIGVPEIDGPARILMVICRPEGARDVSFRSVAIRIVKALTDMGEKAVQLEVLRPPTFAQLGRKLRAAKANGTPYHAVHFDGHGLYLDSGNLLELEHQDTFEPDRLAAPSETTARGFICFEHESRADRMMPIDGTVFGNLLYEADVSTLVLNACRSARGATSAPPQTSDADAVALPTQEDQVRAYGSFAQAVVDAGVGGVVAMRYNVYVVTAAQFVGELYEALAQGRSLGQAATLARKHLSDDRLRAVTAESVELQDWQVPAIYEAAPIRLFAPREIAEPLFDIASTVTGSNLPADLPRTPDAGFVGRDETLLATDRAFDQHPIVLMYAFAGSGKTTTAAEFARWYATTGGVAGPILFNSFEQHVTVARLVDRFCDAIGPMLKAAKVEWLAMDDQKRKRLALNVLTKLPVLWIWDNVEQVAGFPSGTESAWSAADQRDLAEFLRDLALTKAKVLLTSRRDETAWLGDIPVRVRVPPMPMRDCIQLGMALIRHQGGDVRTISALEPLLEFSAGNPLTLRVVVQQSLREKISTPEAADRLVEQLRGGEKSFDDDEEQGRSRSLGASLAYGFTKAFDEDERRRLALLHMFQGRVMTFVVAILEMRLEKRPPDLTVHRQLRERWSKLLTRASEVGLLTALSREAFDAHPALSWFFRSLFNQYYPATPRGDGPSAEAVERYFVETVTGLARSSSDHGSEAEYAQLEAEEDNLRHARRLATQHQWWGLMLDASRILANHYQAAGRSAEFVRLSRTTFEQIVDPTTLKPLPGAESHWLRAMGMAHSLAINQYQPDTAKRLFDAIVEHVLKELGDLKTCDHERMSPEQLRVARHFLHAARMQLGGSTMRLANDELAEAVKFGEEAYDLALRVDMKDEAAAIALHLGHCYFNMGGDNDLSTAEKWYQRVLTNTDAKNVRQRSMVSFELAQLRYARFQKAMETQTNRQSLLDLLNQALEAAHATRVATPAVYPALLLRIHHLLGNILDNGALVSGNDAYRDQGAEHYETAIQIADQLGNNMEGSMLCREMARLKTSMGAFDDARIYAEHAVRRAEATGPGGARAVTMSRQLLDDIEQLRRQTGGARP